MARFRYIALTDEGAKISGVIDARGEREAAIYVRGQGCVPLGLSAVHAAPSFLRLHPGGRRPSLKALALLCGQLAILLDAGIPLARAVHLAAERTSDLPLRRLLRAVGTDVEAGRSLSASLAARSGQMLPETFMEVLRAGEATGSLGASFAALGAHFEQQARTRENVRRAMSYPLFVLALAALVVALVMTVVLPRFLVIFEDLDVLLPSSTLMLIGAVSFFRAHWRLLSLLSLALCLCFLLIKRTLWGKLVLSRLALSLPVLGRIQQLNASSQLSTTLAATLGAGLPLNQAVSIAAGVLDNTYIRQHAARLATEIESGRSLAAAMAEQGVYEGLLVDMCAVGEHSGEMARTLRSAASYYGAELDAAVKKAMAALEPALLVAVASIAGFIVFALYTAVFSLYGSM